jgi:hypothetical protein
LVLQSSLGGFQGRGCWFQPPIPPGVTSAPYNRIEASSRLAYPAAISQASQPNFDGNLKALVLVIMDPSLLDQYIMKYTNVNASRYVCAGAIVVIFYDWLLTLSTEVGTVWKSRKTLVSYLFFIVRVTSFLGTRCRCLIYI